MTSIFLPSGEDVEDICGKEELVSFSDVSCLYPPNQPMTVKYHLGSRVQTSPFDWIGVFPGQWEDVSQPLVHISLPYSDRGGKSRARKKSVTFSVDAVKPLESKNNSYQFVYVDAHQHVLGVSLPFRVTHQRVKDGGKETSSLADKEGENEPDSDFSDSPVLLSSASEDEEDWDMSQHSDTLMLACSADDGIVLEIPEESSASDLSDIVVLSTSPSQEAARAKEEEDKDQVVRETGLAIADKLRDGTDWSQGSDSGLGRTSEDRQGVGEELLAVSTKEEQGDQDVSHPRGKNTKIVFTHSNQQPTPVTKASKGGRCFSRKSEGRVEEDITDAETIPLKSNNLATMRFNGSSLLEQLKIVELDSNSEEDENAANQDQRASAKDKELGRKGRCPELITEIQESERELMLVPNKNSYKVKVIEKVAPTVTKSGVIPSAGMISNTTIPSSKKKSKKMKKKMKRDSTSNRTKDESDEEETGDGQPSNNKLITPSTPLVEATRGCYEDEVMSGWMVKEPEREKGPNENLAFDELSQMSVKNLKDQMKQSRRQERKMLRNESAWTAKVMATAWDEGELYEPHPQSKGTAAPVNAGDISNADDSELKQPKPKRAKKTKQAKKEKIKDTCKESALSMSSAANVPLPVTTSTIAPDAESQPEVKVTPLTQKETAPATADDIAGTEIAPSNRKPVRGVKVKAARKVKRPSSSSKRRAARLSCEFQYLFSVDVKRSACGDEESPGSEEAAESTANTYQESTPTLLPIQDTSENGFPALPSQQGIHCADSMVKCAGGQNDGRADSNEEEKENLDEDDALAEDTLRGTYKSMSPLSVGVKAQGIPYVSPYVLDVMDALPPASVSPDGRAMVEWRRSLLPHVPKHTLPVFHNKYKAKILPPPNAYSQFGRRQDLRRVKLKRASVLSRNGGIIDRIRQQLAQPGSLGQVTKVWPTPSSPNYEPRSNPTRGCSKASEVKKHQDVALPTAQPAPPSYASVLKRAVETKDDSRPEGSKDHGAANNPIPGKENESEDKDVHEASATCLALVPVGAWPAYTNSQPEQEETPKELKADGTPGVERTARRVSSNFPKEYTNYTSSETVTFSPSQLQLVPFKKHNESGSSGVPVYVPSVDGNTKIELSWPKPSFIPCSKVLSQMSASSESKATGLDSQKQDTPSVHIRPSVKGQHKTQADSPPRKVKKTLHPTSKKKASAPVENTQLQTETDGQRALLDMALGSCLVDNAELRSTMASLEKRFETLKTEHQRLKTQKQQDILPMTKVRSTDVVRSAEQRKVPLCKWAGKMARLVRSNVEVISLSAKVKGYEQDIATLTNQVNSLKEALQVETKRSRRALTKWFKLKLKVKVMRSRLRELKENGGRSPFSGPPRSQSQEAPATATVEKTGQALSPLQAWAGKEAEVRKEEAMEEWEPPCKRPKLENHSTSSTTKSTAHKKALAPSPQTTESPVLPSVPSPFKPERTPLSVTPLPPATFASPPICPFFNLFPGGSSGENVRLPLAQNTTQKPTQPLQQATVAPFYHTDSGQGILQQQQQQQQRQHFQIQRPQFLQNVNDYTGTSCTIPQQSHPGFHQQQSAQTPNPRFQLFSEAAPRRSEPGQRKKSPPHLPLPTPTRHSLSPPPGFALPYHLAPHLRQAPPHEHQILIRPSPPATFTPNPETLTHPRTPPGLYQNAASLLPPNAHPFEPYSVGRQFEASNLSPWNPSSPPPSSWGACNLERNPAFYTPLFSYPENQSSHWLHSRSPQAQMDNSTKPINHPDTSSYLQRDVDRNAQNVFGIFNGTGLPDPSYYRDDPSQAGPCRRPLSCFRSQGAQWKPPQPASPPAKYRSDFMRRLMQGEAARSRKQPNPYRLFNSQNEAVDFPPRNNNHDQASPPTSLGLYPFFSSPDAQAASLATAAATLSLASPITAVSAAPNFASTQLLPVTRPEASYRNTTAFVELTADGLLEATRLEMATAPYHSMDARQGNLSSTNGINNSNSSSEEITSLFSTTRRIESQSACQSGNL